MQVWKRSVNRQYWRCYSLKVESRLLERSQGTTLKPVVLSLHLGLIVFKKSVSELVVLSLCETNFLLEK